MSAVRSNDALLKLDNGTGTFVTVAGLRVRKLTLDAAPVDGTNAASPQAWRQLLPGGLHKSAQIEGSGIFKNAASDQLVRQMFFNDGIVTWQILIPACGTVQGLFQIALLELHGEQNLELQFDLKLESAGALSFIPAS